MLSCTRTLPSAWTALGKLAPRLITLSRWIPLHEEFSVFKKDFKERVHHHIYIYVGGLFVPQKKANWPFSELAINFLYTL